MAYKTVFVHTKLFMVDTRTGVKTSIKDSEVGYTYPLSNGKDSVNTGSFIPGNYRVNPYKVWNEEIVSAPILCDCDFIVSKYYHYYSECSGQFLSYLASQHRNTLLPSVAETLKKTALQKAYSKVRQSDLQLGEDIGELRQTLEMLRSPFKSLRDFLFRNGGQNLSKLHSMLNALKAPRTAKDAAKKLDAAASTWLEFRYGFMPLVMTISDLLELAAKKHDLMFDPNKIRSARSSAEDESEHSLSSTSAVTWYTRIYYDVSIADKIKSYACVQYRQATPLGKMEQLGLTAQHLPETLWNLTTLSFVVDWLFSVSAWLGSFRVNPEVTILGNTVGMKVDRNVTVKATKWHNTLNPTATEKKFLAKGVYTYTMYERKINQDLPLLPQFQAGRLMNLFRSIDSLALTWQLILSKIKR